MRRISVVAVTTLALVLVMHWIAPPVIEYPLASGQLYGVPVAGDEALVDLPPADQGRQYLLVVGNAAPDTETRQITIGVQEVDEVEQAPQFVVRPLSSSRLASSIPSMPAPQPTPPQKQRTFWLPVTGGSLENPHTFRQIDSLLMGEGPNVRVYVDRDDAVPASTIDAIVRRFEATILPTTEHYLGRPADLDGDGVFTIVLTSWLGRLDGGRTSIGGMVRPADYLDHLEPPFSNRADLLYLNANVRPGAHLETLLAHELSHAVTCSARSSRGFFGRSAPSEETWLNEAIAHVAENLHSPNWSNLDYRVASYLAAPETSPVVVADYRAAGLWRDPGARGSTYLFLRWCVDQYGPGLLSRLVHSQASGIHNLELATGEPFEHLFRRFSVDLFQRATWNEGLVVRPVDVKHELPPVDLGSPLENWGLAGPRHETWDLAGDDHVDRQVELKGTTSRHFVLLANPRSAMRVRIEAEEGAQLQVTLVRLPDSLPRLRVDVVRAGDEGWRMQVREAVGTEVEVTHVGWHAFGSQLTERPAHRCLSDEQLSELFDRAVVSTDKLLTHPTQFAGMPRGPLLVWVAGRDALGRRTSGWTSLDLTTPNWQLVSKP